MFPSVRYRSWKTHFERFATTRSLFGLQTQEQTVLVFTFSSKTSLCVERGIAVCSAQVFKSRPNFALNGGK